MSEGNSREVISNQSGINERLDELVGKYLHSTNRRPINVHTQVAFANAQDWLAAQKGPLILDNCCGVGASTATLAEQFPDASILGIDKSELRIDKHAHYEATKSNYQVIRADLNDFWRLAGKAGWRCEKQYLLYPNPYPKSTQVQKRWHGSPAFFDMVALGGALEMRSNWRLYLEEVQFVLGKLGMKSAISEVADEKPMTPFESKYQNSGQKCWQLTCDSLSLPV